MSKFTGKKKKDTPGISTASLPDIVFMLLFFFMVATVMRDKEEILKVSVPQATEIVKLKKKTLVSQILIGKPKDAAKFGTASKIQFNDVFGTKNDVISFVENEKSNMLEMNKGKIIISLKVDKETKMGIVSDVKQELRKANALKINYNTIPGSSF